MSAQQIDEALLAITDLPTGWVSKASTSRSSDGGTTTSPTECQALSDELDAMTSASVKKSVTFEKGSGLAAVSLEETIATFAEETATTQGISRIGDMLSKCQKVTITSGGQTSEVTFAAMSFPNLGDRTVATRATAKVGGLTAVLDYVVVAKGQSLVNLVASGVSTLDGAELEKVARAAAAKLTGAGG